MTPADSLFMVLSLLGLAGLTSLLMLAIVLSVMFYHKRYSAMEKEWKNRRKSTWKAFAAKEFENNKAVADAIRDEETIDDHLRQKHEKLKLIIVALVSAAATSFIASGIVALATFSSWM